ncbi:MAG: hypothetical protein E5X37_20415 [Mesorhizobium sp.]|uniref:hypothetical protein n=1 Tax=Mesorhizobium sp. M5C.F.Cr.IN.023.01.1.1 TaxID=2496768 RepID=UPI0011FDD18D|nr:hypothetical protein [Mesorhizobium sp. M5C.F.Cr.IN.023.01.1.1]TIR07779.1 MAG: hypothetical protein E5X37_20415 [Mesorhizobium sp.]
MIAGTFSRELLSFALPRCGADVSSADESDHHGMSSMSSDWQPVLFTQAFVECECGANRRRKLTWRQQIAG